jgi:hypothetical protein
LDEALQWLEKYVAKLERKKQEARAEMIAELRKSFAQTLATSLTKKYEEAAPTEEEMLRIATYWMS